MTTAYEAKQEAKRARLERAAERAQSESDARYRAAAAQIDGIPSGQPILIDHHSAPRHRNALAKHDRYMRKSIDLEKDAKELARRAEAVGTGGISSDDPEAVAKLEDKRTDLERQRDHMKRVNALFKKSDRDGLAALGLDYDTLAVQVAAAYSWEKQPFPAWQITGLAARIRTAKKRVAQIETVAGMEASERVVGLATITVDPSENRVRLAFPSRLTRDDYKNVRAGGFVWSPTRNAFVRKLSQSAIWTADAIAGRITTLEG